MIRLDVRMSAQWKNSYEIEVSRSNVEVEVKPEPGKWEGEYQKKSQGQPGGEDVEDE